jgi:hypothetical protein
MPQHDRRVRSNENLETQLLIRDGTRRHTLALGRVDLELTFATAKWPSRRGYQLTHMCGFCRGHDV